MGLARCSDEVHGGGTGLQRRGGAVEPGSGSRWAELPALQINLPGMRSSRQIALIDCQG
jgi:hypothetical protein